MKIIKKILISISIFLMDKGLYAQGILQPAIFLDEGQLTLYATETVIVNDSQANNGLCMFRGSNTFNGPIWYGPYFHIQGGNYLVQFRLKVSSNASSDYLCAVDIVSSAGGIVYNRLIIRPNMFRNSNEWQLITIPVMLPNNIGNFEIRGIDFRSGISDLFFDYVQIVPNDSKGLYTNEFTISGNGNVGIGTTSPTEKLSVNGKIRAKEIKVETSNWPDYVFENEFNLIPLQELEKFIKTNKHLPEMPSVKETEEQGISLGEMNAKLLQKIEELTLHLIEKDKQLTQAYIQIEEVKERLKAVETIIKKNR